MYVLVVKHMKTCSTSFENRYRYNVLDLNFDEFYE